jgi:hypothetical protein
MHPLHHLEQVQLPLERHLQIQMQNLVLDIQPVNQNVQLVLDIRPVIQDRDQLIERVTKKHQWVESSHLDHQADPQAHHQIVHQAVGQVDQTQQVLEFPAVEEGKQKQNMTQKEKSEGIVKRSVVRDLEELYWMKR